MLWRIPFSNISSLSWTHYEYQLKESERFVTSLRALFIPTPPPPPFSGLTLQNISKCGRSNGATVLSGSCKRRTKRSGSVKWEFYGTFQATREPKETDLTTLESFTLYFTVHPRQTEEKPEPKPGRRREYWIPSGWPNKIKSPINLRL